MKHENLVALERERERVHILKENKIVGAPCPTTKEYPTNVGADASVCPSTKAYNIGVGADASVRPNATKEYNKRRGMGHRAQEPAAITLVALVITIIILIILAGVSLNLALGQNGIFQKSKQAVDKYKNSAQEEQERLDKIFVEMEGAYLPDGFKYLEGNQKDGLVIQNKETKDEFVWIPVKTPIASSQEELTKLVNNNIYPMAVKIDGTTNGKDNYKGVLYNFDINEENNGVKITLINDLDGSKEPEIISEYDGKDQDTAKITKEKLQDEYNKLVESVIKNNGFYIGRYESGNVSQEKVVILKENTDISNQTWYQLYTAQHNIYGDESTTKTHMIWGSQWDQIMIWMKDIKNTSENVTNNKPFYILNSIDMGVYKNNKSSYLNDDKPKSGNFKIKNIYDLAGNVLDWTVECQGNNRMTRGGHYNDPGDKYTLSYRGSGDVPIQSWNVNGSRITLYE